MEQNKMKFIISLPIVAVFIAANATPSLGGAQGSNAWNTNTITSNLASSAPVSTPESKPKYYVKPSAKTPHTAAPNSALVVTDNRFAPDNLDELLTTGRNTNPTAVPARPSYQQAQPQTYQPPQQHAYAPTNPGQQYAGPNPNAYRQYGQGYAPQYGQQFGQGYGTPYGSPYGANGYGPGFNNGFNNFPGGNTYGGFPSMGGFPGFGSPSTNFSPFGFW